MRDELLKSAARNVIKNCMGVRSEEKLLVITDRERRGIGTLLFDAGKEIGAEVYLLEIVPPSVHGSEPSPIVSEMMKMVDVILAPTTKSITHTMARREATRLGKRIATMPGITEDMMARTLNADYTEIARRSIKVADILDRGRIVRVTSPRGTNIEMVIDGRFAKADTGLNRESGDYSNLPAGEAFLAPVEGLSEGVIVFDGAVPGLGEDAKGLIRVRVEKGQLVSAEGEGAENFLKLLDGAGEGGRNLAEFGVGTNDMAKLTGNILEDEKVMGTVHIAFGNNLSMGGVVDVPIHLDGMILSPTVYIDGVLLMEDGRLLL